MTLTKKPNFQYQTEEEEKELVERSDARVNSRVIWSADIIYSHQVLLWAEKSLGINRIGGRSRLWAVSALAIGKAYIFYY